MKELQVRNRQRVRRVDARRLRGITTGLLEDLLAIRSYELGIHLVSARLMAEMNDQYLGHSGPTDVITFSFLEVPQRSKIAGEIFICVSVAETQSREFRTTWQAEVVRYIVHGVLHLIGYDDLTPAKRKVMKREENRLVRTLERQLDFALVGS